MRIGPSGLTGFARHTTLPLLLLSLEVWPESHWPGFALRQADVFQSYAV